MRDVVGRPAVPVGDVAPLGRPPAGDSSETRRKIIVAARGEFARHGFNGASNRDLVSSIGITAAALYHYFDSKLALYVAVYADVERQVRARFSDVLTTHPGFVDRVEALLDSVHQMNRDDRTLAAFVGVARADIRRDQSVAAALASTEVRRRFFLDGLVADAIQKGEIHADHRSVVVDVLDMMLDGLSDTVSESLERQARAVSGIKMLLRNELLATPSPV